MTIPTTTFSLITIIHAIPEENTNQLYLSTANGGRKFGPNIYGKVKWMKKFATFATYALAIIIFILIGLFGHVLYKLPRNTSPITEAVSQIKPTPLAKYTIENLSNTTFKESKIEIGGVLSDNEKFTSYKYSMSFNPSLSEETKNTTGMVNIPKKEGDFPVIVMFRGFVNQEIYVTGMGTKPSATVFAERGYITLAPDFLGYGGSDKEADNIFESRFQTYVAAAVTLKSIGSIEKWDKTNAFIWGHSNGGQIALTTLEITGMEYPTVLWAPVGRPFPASILYYIDGANDNGKLLIKELAEFQDVYDSQEFSLTQHFDKINAPIEIHQGTADTAVPYWWSDELVKSLESVDVDTTYKKYLGADHNMVPSWNNAVENSLLFFNSRIK